MFFAIGKDDPRKMPSWLFPRAVWLDYDSAVRGDPSKQNFSMLPRFWYIDATIKCAKCRKNFAFTAGEQKAWYEVHGFYVDSFAKDCPKCRKNARRMKVLRQKYDRDVAAVVKDDEIEPKKKMIDVIDELCGGGVDLPPRMHVNRKRLAKQLARSARAGE